MEDIVTFGKYIGIIESHVDNTFNQGDIDEYSITELPLKKMELGKVKAKQEVCIDKILFFNKAKPIDSPMFEIPFLFWDAINNKINEIKSREITQPELTLAKYLSDDNQ